MPDWGGDAFDVTAIEHAGIVSSGASTGTAVATGGSHAKGAWVELAAATVREGMPLVAFRYPHGSGEMTLMDLGVGAAGSEQPLIENVHLPLHDAGVMQVPLPVRVPAGSRLAARGQGAAGKTIIASAAILAGGFGMAPLGSRTYNHGANLADETGTLLDSGSTENAKGAWVQLAAATERDYRALVVHHVFRGDAFGNYDYLVDIGVGAAGSEVVRIPDMRAHIYDFGGGVPRPEYPTLYPVKIPAGSRIAARVQADALNTNYGDSLASHTIDINVHGVA